MTAATRDVGDAQRRAWWVYAERLRGLQGAEYDRAEQEAWDDLQAALDALEPGPRRERHPVE